MLRLTYSLLATGLLLVASCLPTGNQAAFVTPAAQVADGTDPVPPPYPLAVPGRLSLPQVADGTDPVPPPYPLAVPGGMAVSV